MKITTTGRKVTLKPSFIDKAEKRLAKLDKFFSDSASAQVTVTVEKTIQTVEITVRDRGFVARAEKSAPRMEDALDSAADLLTKRIVKNRKRIETQLHRAEEIPEPTDAAAEVQEEVYQVVREKRFVVKPQSVEEAILEMNLVGHEFFLFRNAETGTINAVYRRKDGTYGLLIPQD